MGDAENAPRGTREELYTTRQIADWLGLHPSSVPKAMHRAGIDTVTGYPAAAVRRWVARRPGKGFHAGPGRPKPGQAPPQPRAACPACGRNVAMTPQGIVYKHRPAGGTEPGSDGLCRGSWQPVVEQKEVE